MTASSMRRLLDQYEDGLYSKLELPSVVVQILDESDTPQEAWEALPIWVRTEVGKLLANADRDDLIVLHEDEDGRQMAVLQLRRVRNILQDRELLLDE